MFGQNKLDNKEFGVAVVKSEICMRRTKQSISFKLSENQGVEASYSVSNFLIKGEVQIDGHFCHSFFCNLKIRNACLIQPSHGPSAAGRDL